MASDASKKPAAQYHFDRVTTFTIIITEKD
jgi:hypothetical protein